MRPTSSKIGLVLIGFSVFACGGTSQSKVDFVRDPSTFGGTGLVHIVVEIPAGTNDKWEVDGQSGKLHWEIKDGKPRVVQYLPYPGNYGMIPGTALPEAIGGDGDPLDILLMAPRVERGSVVEARPIGVLRLIDDGERDDKILAVGVSGPLSDVTDLEALDSRYPGVRDIVETWFTHYKGPGRTRSTGFAGADSAMAAVREAHEYFEQAMRGKP